MLMIWSKILLHIYTPKAYRFKEDEWEMQQNRNLFNVNYRNAIRPQAIVYLCIRNPRVGTIARATEMKTQLGTNVYKRCDGEPRLYGSQTQ